MWTRLRAQLLDITQAATLGVALKRVGEYAGLRAWALVIACFPIEVNLRTARVLGRLWWLLMTKHRKRALEHLRPALGDRYSEAELRRIARASFEHFAQLYLVELVIAGSRINIWSWSRNVELGNLGPALRELLRGRGGESGGPAPPDEAEPVRTGRGVILLTGHFGNYELLGYTVARLGLPLVAVMRPLDNPLINDYLVRSRAAGGLELVYKKEVAATAGDVLDRGGGLCFIADQDAGRKGVFVDFFGRKASTYKSIALLAMQKRAPIVVGSAVRTRPGFHYRIDVQRIIRPEEWEAQPDPLLWTTQAFTAALESAVRRAPEQYLWIHRRWKHRPPDEQPLETRLAASARRLARRARRAATGAGPAADDRASG